MIKMKEQNKMKENVNEKYLLRLKNLLNGRGLRADTLLLPASTESVPHPRITFAGAGVEFGRFAVLNQDQEHCSSAGVRQDNAQKKRMGGARAPT